MNMNMNMNMNMITYVSQDACMLCVLLRMHMFIQEYTYK